MWVPENSHHRAALSLAVPRGLEICPCGAQLMAREWSVQVTGLSPALQGFFQDQTFCSFRCVRASFLDILSELESIATPSAESTVTDLRATYASLASAFADLLEDWDLRGHDPNLGM